MSRKNTGKAADSTADAVESFKSRREGRPRPIMTRRGTGCDRISAAGFDAFVRNPLVG
jgi:hypothetical protein